MNNELFITRFCEEHPLLNAVKLPVREAAESIIKCYSGGGKLLVCGNGGSCSDSDHLVAELMKSFEVPRPLEKSFRKRLAETGGSQGEYLAGKLEHALPVISLSAHSSLITAVSNDTGPEMVFAQQLLGYGMENDILIALSTSGNSVNVLYACITARALNLKIIGITGKSGGTIRDYCDVLINVPAEGAASVQELQLPVLHTLCRIAENHFYGSKTKTYETGIAQ